MLLVGHVPTAFWTSCLFLGFFWWEITVTVSWYIQGTLQCFCCIAVWAFGISWKIQLWGRELQLGLIYWGREGELCAPTMNKMLHVLFFHFGAYRILKFFFLQWRLFNHQQSFQVDHVIPVQLIVAELVRWNVEGSQANTTVPAQMKMRMPMQVLQFFFYVKHSKFTLYSKLQLQAKVLC